MALSKLCRWRKSLCFLLLQVVLETLLVHSSSRTLENDANNFNRNVGSSLRKHQEKRKATSKSKSRSTITAKTTTTDSAAKSFRIVGGTDASNVSYFVLWGGCGATLIHNDIALSAAHCFERKDAQVGPKNRSDNRGWTRVNEVRKHPMYNSASYDYDFAVLKLNGWFQHDTVRLNVSDDTPRIGESLQILGFGGESDELKSGRVNAVSPSICAEQWSRAGYYIEENAILCAKADGVVDACTGDSGGPLLLDGSTTQVGVISSGSGCDGRLPTVYSRVSAGQDWIREQICELSDFPPEFCSPFNRGPTLGRIRIRVDVILDEYPQDIRWSITEDSSTSGSSKTLASGENFQIPNSLESQFVDLPNNQSYVFTIEDVSGFGDGLSNDGGYEIVIVDQNGNDADTLASGGNNFQDFESTSFTIGNAPNSIPDPTHEPTYYPTSEPTFSPTIGWFITSPTENPTEEETEQLTDTLTEELTVLPTVSPTVSPTREEAREPTDIPTSFPTNDTTRRPSSPPSKIPTEVPTVAATDFPTKTATEFPTEEPTEYPTKITEPTKEPTPAPTPEPTSLPTRIRQQTPEPTKIEINDVVDEEEDDDTAANTFNDAVDINEAHDTAANDDDDDFFGS